MAWEKDLPEWQAPGAQPPEGKRGAEGGWEPEEKPPAGWFNWLFNRAYECLVEIREAIDALLHGTTGHDHSGADGEGPNLTPGNVGLGNVTNEKQAPESRQINSGDYLSGGGDLSEDRTLDVDGNAIRTLTTELRREVVSSFPTAGLVDGRTVLLTQADGGNDPGPYTYFDGEWL